MISSFQKSRVIMGLGCFATLAVAAAVIFARRAQPFWLTCITLLLLLPLGILFSRLLAGMVAAREHQKLLAVLYVQLDPARFLQQYTHIPMRSGAGTTHGMMSTVYLTDGLCAAGRYDEALAVLNRCSVSEHTPNALALECLLCNSKCHCLLQKGDTATAADAMLQYGGLLQRAQQENPKLAENLSAQYAAFGQELCFLQGKPVDVSAVQAAAAHAPVLIRRLELTLLEARVYAQNQNYEQANLCCSSVLNAGNQLALSRQAQMLMH